jgi:hypothetical protein
MIRTGTGAFYLLLVGAPFGVDCENHAVLLRRPRILKRILKGQEIKKAGSPMLRIAIVTGSSLELV